MKPETNEHVTQESEDEGPWWSMSPKTQIIAIAVGIGLFNCLLIAIFAAVVFLRAG